MKELRYSMIKSSRAIIAPLFFLTRTEVFPRLLALTAADVSLPHGKWTRSTL
jgi:hypothetical protein